MKNYSNVINKIVAENIKKYRKKTGLSQVSLCVLLKRNPDYISQIECGYRTPTLKNLCEIAQALNIEPYELLTDEKE